MKVTVRTFGGLAPALQPPPREVEASALQPRDAHALAKLVEAVPESAPQSPPRPDERHYEVTIHAGESCKVLHCADSTMPDAVAKLLDFVDVHGRRC